MGHWTALLCEGSEGARETRETASRKEDREEQC